MIELADILSLASGAAVGLMLGLIGGGGSILAVPLMIYVVRVEDTHIAIGTSAVAVAASALFNLAGHARSGHVKWKCALAFAGFGMLGAVIGSNIGKATDGRLLLGLFGLIMITIGAAMLRRKSTVGDPFVNLTRETAARLMPRIGFAGMAVGAMSGFFGIGGGFLIVPGLIASTAMPMLNAVGSSLVSVSTFGATTAGNYAIDGMVDWRVAGLFVVGGIAGGLVGISLASRLGQGKETLRYVFSGVVILVGVLIAGDGALDIWRALSAPGGG